MELSLINVTKKYGENIALHDITYTFEDGITGLLGPNGAGKSTLMRMLSTVDIPTTGIIKLDGENIAEHPERLRSMLGYLPQDFGVYPNLNPIEFLEYMAAMKNLNMKSAKIRINELLEVLHLKNARKRLLGGFSGGMKQRVGIAQALLGDPSILIVDEPTVGLDPVERIQFRNLLSTLSLNRIIILSTHIVTDIESIAPRIVVLSNSNLVCQTTPEYLIERVEGRVWECTVTGEKMKELQEKFIISNSMQRKEGVHIRMVSDRRPVLEAVAASPTMEDAYLYITSKGVSM